MSTDAADWRPTASIETLRRRAALVAAVRGFFGARGLLEIETPLLVRHGVTDVHLASLPLAAPAMVSAYLVSLAMCISNFVAPLLLGRGVVVFTTNLMYTRFSDIGNYQAGAAIGVFMLIASFAVVYGLATIAKKLLPSVVPTR